jgi:hypothetical protein
VNVEAPPVEAGDPQPSILPSVGKAMTARHWALLAELLVLAVRESVRPSFRLDTTPRARLPTVLCHVREHVRLAGASEAVTGLPTAVGLGAVAAQLVFRRLGRLDTNRRKPCSALRTKVGFDRQYGRIRCWTARRCPLPQLLDSAGLPSHPGLWNGCAPSNNACPL